MINNFELISNLIRNKAGLGEFYFLQILKRRKDNPDMERDMNVIDNFFIKGAEDLERKQKRIIELCYNNNARAYFRLNKRSERKVALQTLRLIAENIAADNYDIKNCYTSCCGQYHSDENKTWIVDIDTNEQKQHHQQIIDAIRKGQEFSSKYNIIDCIPTKNGFHIITNPFNIQEYNKLLQPFVDCKELTMPDIHKDNPTILYIP
jgi:hypothetical protein